MGVIQLRLEQPGQAANLSQSVSPPVSPMLCHVTCDSSHRGYASPVPQLWAWSGDLFWPMRLAECPKQGAGRVLGGSPLLQSEQPPQPDHGAGSRPGPATDPGGAAVLRSLRIAAVLVAVQSSPGPAHTPAWASEFCHCSYEEPADGPGEGSTAW